MYSITYNSTWKRCVYSGQPVWTGTTAKTQMNAVVSVFDQLVTEGILAWDSRDYTPADDYSFGTSRSDIYHFDDDLHATLPLYFRLRQYINQSTAGSGSVFSIVPEISWSSSGPWSSFETRAYYGSANGAVYPARLSLTGDTGWFGFAVNDGANTSYSDTNFLVSRAVNQTTGVAKSGASVVGTDNSQSEWSTTVLSHEYSSHVTQPQPTWVPNDTVFTSSVAPSIELDAHRLWYSLDGAMHVNPYIVAVYESEFTFGVPFTVAPFAPHGNHTFMALNRSFPSSTREAVLAHRWEA